MCGICGIVYHDAQRPVDPGLLQRMTDVISHRGPDDQGHFFDPGIGLGSRRLSIVGLESGHMPMSSDDGSIVVVYNGEMYNYPGLKKLLQEKGYTFRTSSDTETFIHLYREFGDECLKHVRGMFAVALWDRKERKLILGRDRIGIKPLYYQMDGTGLRFASEVKSLLCDAEVPRQLNPNGLNFFLCYLSVPAPFTLFQGIKQLLPGEVLILKNGELTKRSYWEPEKKISLDLSHVDLMKEELLRRLRLTVQEHLMADVPVGAFLSGGIDSSVLALLMKEAIGSDFKTFSIGFEGNALFDETPYARKMAQILGTEHHEMILRPGDLLSALDDITWQLDEPLADSSCLPVYYVSQLAAQHVKVVLSGDGGDEIFAGYRKYQAEYFRKYVKWMPKEWQNRLSQAVERTLPESRSNVAMDYLRQVKKFFRGLDPNPFERHLRWALHFEDSLREEILLPDVKKQINFYMPRNYRADLFQELPFGDELNHMLWTDLRHNLPSDMLMKVDRMSMLHSLEVRVPFLDHKLVEYAFSLPGEVKLMGKETKWILKDTFHDLLPADILYRRKHGFDVPVGEWFRHELRDVIEDICSEETARRRGLFSPRRLRQLCRDHQDRRRDLNNQLWILLSLELWQRQYLDSPPGTVPPRPGAAGSL